MSFLEFAWAVLFYWQAYITGGMVAATLFMYERIKKKNVPTRWIQGGALAFLFVGCFMAWRDERNAWRDERYKVAEQKKEVERLNGIVNDLSYPRLEAETTMYIGEAEESVVFIIMGSIRNQGAPSVVNRLGLLLDTKEGDLKPSPLVMEEGTDLDLGLSGNGATIKYKSLAEQVAERPIERNGQRVGHLVFMVKGVSLSQYYEIRQRERLTFEDILGKVYSVPIAPPPKGFDPSFVPYIPGTKAKPRKAISQ